MSIEFESLPFDEQIAYFLQKLSVPTQAWNDLLGAAHDKAFTVAGATAAALLEDLRQLVADMLENGLTFDEFQVQFEDIVAKNGWTGWTGEGSAGGVAWRSKVIAETNLSTSYSAGRWSQINATKDARPYLMYHHARGERYPRPEHMAWDGMVLPADHQWWDTHYPPNGFGCKCTVLTLSANEIEMRGLSVTQDEQIPPGEPDQGWDYAPGASWRPDPTAMDPDIAQSLQNFIDKSGAK